MAVCVFFLFFFLFFLTTHKRREELEERSSQRVVNYTALSLGDQMDGENSLRNNYIND